MPKQLLPLFIETNGNKWNTSAIWTWMKTVGPLTKRSVRQDLTTTKVKRLCSIRSETDVRKKAIAWFLVFNIYHFQNENALLAYQMNGKSAITKLPQWREAIIHSWCIMCTHFFHVTVEAWSDTSSPSTHRADEDEDRAGPGLLTQCCCVPRSCWGAEI